MISKDKKKKGRTLDDLAKIEKAIKDKYGDKTIQNIRAGWDEEKEKEYLSQMKELYEKENKLRSKQDKKDYNGVSIPSALINKDSNRTCPICKKYSFKIRDDVYMIKFRCCWTCYIKHYEGREEKLVEIRKNENEKNEV